MTTQIFKTLKTDGSGADNFTTTAAAFAYVKGLDCVGLDVNVVIRDYIGVVWGQDIGPTSYSDTQRVTWTNPLGAGVNDLNRNAFAYGTTGTEVTFPRLQYDLNLKGGVDYENIRIHITETGQTFGVAGTGNGSGIDNTFRFCRVYDSSTSGGPTCAFGAGQSRQIFSDCLIVMDGGARTFYRDKSGKTRSNRCTFVALGASLNTAQVATSDYGGSTITDSLFIGFGSTIADGNTVITTSYSNTQPTAGRISGITVVTGTGGLVVNESTDLTPSANSPLIGAASSVANGTLDILGNNRGPGPDIGAKQRTPYAPSPTGVITSITVSNTTGNKRRVTISGTTTGSPTSGLASITPTNATGNNAVAQSNLALTFGSGTFSVAIDDCKVGKYNETVSLTNAGGTTAATGTAAFEVIGAMGVITSQPPIDGQFQSISGTTTGSPDSGSIIWPADPSSSGTTAQGPFALTLGAGTFSDTQRALSGGVYLTPLVTFTTAAGTSFPASGGSPVTVMTFSGNPEIPPSTSTPPTSTVTSVTVSPDGAVVMGSGTKLFFATVQGTNSPSQTVTWSKISGVGSISSDGTYTAPVATNSVQTGVFRATSIQDVTFYDDFTVTVSVATSFSARITVPLGSAAANLTGLKWAWHDQPTPDLFVGPPTDKGAVETADSAGTVVILLPNSTKTASGQIGHIEIMNSDGTTTTPYSGFVGPWAVD